MKTQVKTNVMALKPAATNNNGSSPFNKVKWMFILLLLGAGIVANYYYRDISWVYRLMAWLGATPVLLFVVYQTNEGKKSWGFINDARVELRKITWPTKQETIQTSMIIAAMVVILSIALWGIDGLLMWLIGWLTGQRG